jgi:hypothetical protein
MARPLRLEYEGAVYYVTARGNALQPIYRDEVDRKRFLHLLGEEIDQQRWGCYAYCLMRNHYHYSFFFLEATVERGRSMLKRHAYVIFIIVFLVLFSSTVGAAEPSKRSCTLTVHFPNAQSAEISLSTRRSVVTFNAELKVVKNSLLVFPQ